MPDAQGYQSFLKEERWSFWGGLDCKKKKKKKNTRKSPARSHTETSRELLCKPDVCARAKTQAGGGSEGISDTIKD